MSNFQSLLTMKPIESVVKIEKEASFEYYLTAAAGLKEDNSSVKEEIEIKEELPLLDWVEYPTIKEEKNSTLDQKDHHDAPTLPCRLSADCTDASKQRSPNSSCNKREHSREDESCKGLYGSDCETKLNHHLKTYAGEKPFQCEHCSFRSAQKGTLVRHLRTHTGEKHYTCNQCSFSCARKYSLDSHLRTHAGEKPYQCEQCPFSCAHKQNLVVHLRTHTGEKPFKCEQCSYSCAHKGALVMHIRTHTREKPFKCDQCSYSCTQKGSLVVHLRTHSGEKPFKCEQCSFS